MRLFFLFLLLALAACKREAPPPTTTPLPNREARNFSLTPQADGLLLTIHETWQGGGKQQFLLYPRELLGQAPNLPEGAKLVATPVERIVCTSTIQAAMLDKLGAADKIVAMSDGKYLYNQNIINHLQSGKIIDLGNDQIIDYEKLIAAQPDMILLFGLQAPAKLEAKLQELRLPYLYMAEYIEPSPLARAEWICVLAALLGQYKEATQIFDNQIFTPYQNLKNSIANAPHKPKILTGIAYEGTWYLPGGRNFLAQLIADAQGQYLYAADTNRSSIALPFERVYADGQQADIWINVSQATNRAQLLDFDPRYADFRAFANGQIYSYHRRVSPAGGFDIFESAVVQPHLLLNDFIQIFHPDSSRQDSLYYYLPLN